MDRFSKTCLALVVVLLAMIALRPIFLPHSAQAAGPHKYIAARPGEEGKYPTIQGTLDGYASDGWTLVATIALPDASSQPILIFQK